MPRMPAPMDRPRNLPWEALAGLAGTVLPAVQRVLEGSAAEREIDRLLRAHPELSAEQRTATVEAIFGVGLWRRRLAAHAGSYEPSSLLFALLRDLGGVGDQRAAELAGLAPPLPPLVPAPERLADRAARAGAARRDGARLLRRRRGEDARARLHDARSRAADGLRPGRRTHPAAPPAGDPGRRAGGDRARAWRAGRCGAGRCALLRAGHAAPRAGPALPAARARRPALSGPAAGDPRVGAAQREAGRAAGVRDLYAAAGRGRGGRARAGAGASGAAPLGAGRARGAGARRLPPHLPSSARYGRLLRRRLA